MKIRLLLPVLAITFLLAVACNQNKKDSSTTASAGDPTAAEKPKEEAKMPPPPPRPATDYYGVAMKGNAENYKKLNDSLSKEQMRIVFAINRIEKNTLRRADTIVVPTTWHSSLLDYSPFPAQLPVLKDVKKMVLFSYPIQAWAAYENGTLKKWGPTSMGSKAHKTPTGLHYANWKGRKIHSSVDYSWILEFNFNIMNHGGVGWHQYQLPGYPASHSCLRLLMDDAEWLYTFADQWTLQNQQQVAKGTPVLVFGEYPWGERRPWYHLLENPKANDQTVDQLSKLLEPKLEEILREQANTDKLKNQKSEEASMAGADTAATQAP